MMQATSATAQSTRRVIAFLRISLMIHVPLVVELVLGVLQIVVHQQLAGFLNVRVAVRHGLAVG